MTGLQGLVSSENRGDFRTQAKWNNNKHTTLTVLNLYIYTYQFAVVKKKHDINVFPMVGSVHTKILTSEMLGQKKFSLCRGVLNPPLSSSRAPSLGRTFIYMLHFCFCLFTL